MATVKAALEEGARRLAGAGVADAQQEAAWLLAHVLHASAGSLRVRSAETLSADDAARFAALVDRRSAREPIQYILGTEEFMGLEFTVTPAVLIPRLDTAVLVEAAVERLGRGAARVADIGTGSGAIAVAVAALLPAVTVVAVDISPDALAVARQNAERHGVATRIEFRRGDLLVPLAGELFDAVLSNPPYIDEPEWEGLMPEVVRWEPKGALTPGPDGLVMYRRLAAEGPRLLRPGGFLAVEVGYQQAAAVAELFTTAGMEATVLRDTAGIERVVIGRPLV
ncbi:MAG TPA: peptide chain release factor N(5)-glutamine methyltransferase [Symbiobacteriaceae bacterium]|jgi:release factor glutamine methyltransferase|nr:peptide chain release factor N(5)-glutamine methyltransferase [Symbiobacteriaceae bacterium]